MQRLLFVNRHLIYPFIYLCIFSACDWGAAALNHCELRRVESSTEKNTVQPSFLPLLQSGDYTTVQLVDLLTDQVSKECRNKEDHLNFGRVYCVCCTA